MEFESDDSQFNDDLRLMKKDLKTVQRILSVKFFRSEIFTLNYNKFDWLKCVLKLWHFELNWLQIIHKVHWNDEKFCDASSLQYAANTWHKTQIAQSNTFQSLKRLIIHNYQTRVVALWIHLIRTIINCFNFERIEYTENWLKAQSANSFNSWMKLFRCIDRNLHQLITTFNNFTDFVMSDEIFFNHQNYCVHVKLYLTLHHST